MIKIKLKHLIEERGMTQSTLAKETGIRSATINELCNEKCKYISLQNLELICEKLNCDPGELIIYESKKDYFIERRREKMRYSYTIQETSREERKNMLADALALSQLDAPAPTPKTKQELQNYVDGKKELDTILRETIEFYQE